MVMLRDVVENDLPTFFEHQREPEGNEMAAFPARDREPFMTHWRTKILGHPTNISKTIVDEEQHVVGNILCWTQDEMRFVGYWIGRAHWGRGLASAALMELLTKYETTRPVHAFVASRNVGSVRVLEKCGFRPVGAPTTHDGVEELLLKLE